MTTLSPFKFRWLACLAVIAPLLVGARSGYAQATSCTTLISNLDLAIRECSEINRNWVCYGSLMAEANPVKYRFFQTRDRRPFAVLEQIETKDKNGVVLMNLQLDADFAPVTVILFGAMALQTGDQTNRSLIVTVKEGQLLCDATPPGIVVHTDEGEVGMVTINGVDIKLASTAYITFQPNGVMEISNIEGDVWVTIAGVARSLTPGQAINVAFVNGTPQLSEDIVDSPYFASTAAHWLGERGLARVQDSNAEERLACTSQLTFGAVITDTNRDPGQECLYRFCANRGDAVTVDMQALDSTLDPWLDLRGPGGSLVSFNNDVDGGDHNSLICNRVLPLTSCDYTIVARSDHNESAGLFQLKLDKRTSCVQPELRCEVVARTGSPLYANPDARSNAIDDLPQGSQLHPIERTADGAWALVQVGDTGQTGWVQQRPETVECEDDRSLPAPPVTGPAPTITPLVALPKPTDEPSTPNDPRELPTDTPTATPVPPDPPTDTPTATSTNSTPPDTPTPTYTPTPLKEGPIAVP